MERFCNGGTQLCRPVQFPGNEYLNFGVYCIMRRNCYRTDSVLFATFEILKFSLSSESSESVSRLGLSIREVRTAETDDLT